MCAVFVVILVLSMMAFISLPTTSADRTKAMTLPFMTSWETMDKQGLVGPLCSVDWSLNFSNPLLKVVSNSSGTPDPGYVAPPSPGVFGYDFGVQELLATGTFGASYSYCYFNLFDQSAVCDSQPPFQLRQHTYLSIWHYNVQHADCMIDGLLYDQNTGQYQTLRDFSYQNSSGATCYIVDQNNVRIHPAQRLNDPQGQWCYSCFDLSPIWNSDPGGWWVEKLWIGFDNGQDHQTGPATTIFDLLFISYGGNAYSNTVNVYDSNSVDNSVSGACTTGSVVLCGLYQPVQGQYYLAAKVAVTGQLAQVSNQPYYSVIYPDTLYVSVGVKGAEVLQSPEPTGINLTSIDSKYPQGKVAQFLFDVGMTVASSIPGIGAVGYMISALQLALEAAGLASKPSQKATYTWPEENLYYDGAWDQNYCSGVTFDMGEAYVYIPITLGQSYSIPITLSIDYYACVYIPPDIPPPIGQPTIYWAPVDTGSVTVNLNFNSNPDQTPSANQPTISIIHPTFGDLSLTHAGNSNSNDCTMTVSLNGQGPIAYTGADPTLSITYYGSMWARPGAPGNIMFVALGIGNTPLSETGGGTPGVYPGGTYDTTFSYSLPQSSGLYNVYGVAAAVYTSAQASQQYVNCPWTRFLVGMIDVNGGQPIVFIHGPTFTVSANISPPPCFLLSPQPYNGQNYYASCYLTDSNGNPLGNAVYLPCTQPVSQSQGTGGVFSGTYNLAGLTPNNYYYVCFYANSTNGQSLTQSELFYYYDNAPWTPQPPSGTPQYVYTSYPISTVTNDPDGDNINYSYNWGDGQTWTSGWVASGTSVSPSHYWTTPGTYTVSVQAEDTYGLWSNPATLQVTVASLPKGGGGGCPYVSTWNGTGYVLDNNILPDSESSGGHNVVDYYRLEQPLVPTVQNGGTSTYSVKISEFEHEHDYIDQVELFAVDHAAGVNVAVSPSGEILTYEHPASPVSAISNEGTDVLPLLKTADGNYYQSYNGSYITVTFAPVDVSRGAKLVIVDKDLILKDCPINVQVLNANGQWSTVAVFHTRVNWETDIINMTGYLPDAQGNFKVRLCFNAVDEIDFIGLDTTPQANIQVHEATLLSAISSMQGNVTQLLQATDGKYAQLLPGQQITLKFQLPTNRNSQITFIIYTSGYYEEIP